MRQHAPEDGESCWRLLIKPAERRTWKSLQILERGKCWDRHLEGVEISGLELLPVDHCSGMSSVGKVLKPCAAWSEGSNLYGPCPELPVTWLPPFIFFLSTTSWWIVQNGSFEIRQICMFLVTENWIWDSDRIAGPEVLPGRVRPGAEVGHILLFLLDKSSIMYIVSILCNPISILESL